MTTSSGPGSFWDEVLHEAGDVDGGDAEAEFWGEEIGGGRGHAAPTKDCVLFLVDSSASMARRRAGDSPSPLQAAVRCCVEVMTDKVVSSEDDLCGLVFYSCRDTRNPGDFANVFLEMEPDVPDAERILALENMVASTEIPRGSCDAGEASVATSHAARLSDALWVCSAAFSAAVARGGRLAHRRIFLFTDCVNPVAGGGEGDRAREKCVQRARDLAELGITVELFLMGCGKAEESAGGSLGSSSQRSLGGSQGQFWSELLLANGADDASVRCSLLGADGKFEELRSSVRRKEYRKRTMARLPLTIGQPSQDGAAVAEMAVKVYNLRRKAEKGRFVMLDTKTNQPLKSSTTLVSENTRAILSRDQARRLVNVGGEDITFSEEEIAKIKSWSHAPRGIRVLGFKPLKALRRERENIRPATFVYPDDRAVKGSTVAMSALLEQMLQKEKVAVVSIVPRDGAPMRLGALVPQREVYERDGTMAVPGGFHLVPIPFADDVRDISLKEMKSVPERPSPEAIDKAKTVVRRLRIQFDSRDFENPALQRHYAALQALALDRDAMDVTRDLVLPDAEGLARFTAVIAELRQAVYPAGYVPGSGSKAGDAASRKRARGDGEGDEESAVPPPKKKGKSADDFDWDAAAEEGPSAVAKATVPQLREFLKSRGVKVASKDKKDQLVSLALQTLTSGDSSVVSASLPAGAPDQSVAQSDAAPPASSSAASASASLAASVSTDDPMPVDVPDKPPCRYGERCYRTSNKDHMTQFSHPPKK